mgnify:FL=1
MTSCKNHCVFLSLLLFLFALCYQRVFVLTLCCCMVLWMLRTKDNSFIFVCIVLLLFSIPRSNTKYPDIQEANAIQVSSSYAILKNGNQKIIVYTKEPLLFDAAYTVTPEFQKVEESCHTYGFSYSHWLSKQGIYYAVDESCITLKKENVSIRRWMQKKIAALEDPSIRSLLNKSLLNLKDTQGNSWMKEAGFSYISILFVFHVMCKYVMHEKQKDVVLTVITILLLIVYRFPLILVENLLFRVSRYLSMSKQKSTSLITMFIMFCYPSEITSASFLIPSLYHYSFLFDEHKKEILFLLISIIQSILFQTINPLRSFLYPVNMFLHGFFYLFSLVRFFTPIDLVSLIASALQSFNTLMNLFSLKGSIVGVGCILYIIIVSMFRHKVKAAIVLLYVFQITGLFHPCMEMTMINVGQGDAILIRAPLNSDNILIDTGKPSAYNSLKTYLDAKSIYVMNTLIITHNDNDHSGNKTNIQKDYVVKQCIETHQNIIQSSIFTLQDINEIQSEDENDSSIVNVMNFNDKQVCLMGDASNKTEEEITHKYPTLSCDILKLGHHGSSTSSSDQFLDVVRPEIALISSGAYRIYHHPSEETIQKLLKRHIPYFDTKTSGDITILCFGKIRVFITSRFEIGLI